MLARSRTSSSRLCRTYDSLKIILVYRSWRYFLSVCTPRHTSFPSWLSWKFAILKNNLLRFQLNRDLEEIVCIVLSFVIQDYICTLYESSRTHFHTSLKYSPIYQSSHGFPSPLRSVLWYCQWRAIFKTLLHNPDVIYYCSIFPT